MKTPYFFKVPLEGAVGRLQDAAKLVFDALVALPLSEQVLVKRVELTAAADNFIPVQLGQPLKGVILVRAEQQTIVWLGESPDKRFANVQTSATGPVDLLFF